MQCRKFISWKILIMYVQSFLPQLDPTIICDNPTKHNTEWLFKNDPISIQNAAIQSRRLCANNVETPPRIFWHCDIHNK